MNYNNMRIIHGNGSFLDYTYIIDENTYDTEYIKNYIDTHDSKEDIETRIKVFGYVKIATDLDIHNIIVDVEFINSDVNTPTVYYNEYVKQLEHFKHLHRDYQLKGIINEL